MRNKNKIMATRSHKLADLILIEVLHTHPRATLEKFNTENSARPKYKINLTGSFDQPIYLMEDGNSEEKESIERRDEKILNRFTKIKDKDKVSWKKLNTLAP